MDIRAELEQITTRLEKKKEFVVAQLNSLPEGRLLHTRSGGRNAVLLIKGHGKTRKRQAITKDPALQVKIARRELLEKDLLQTEQQITGLKDLLYEIRCSQSDVFRYAVRRYPWFDDEQLRQLFAKEEKDEWAAAEFEQSDYKKEKRQMVTSRGLSVRSKSELLVAEALYRYDLPFRYEQVYRPDDKHTVAADFTIRRIDGKLFIWEHEGLITVDSYVAWQRRKAELYASIGFVPWDNLIVTYDTDGGNIDLRIVESEIRNRLLI